MSEIATSRLLLRQWRPDDLPPFAALNADPEVMRYFPAPLTSEQSAEFAAHIQATIARQGWGLWAVEVVGGAPFIGFVGLNRTRFDAHFTPTVEVGWRLDRRYWGRGYATEAAAASLAFGFDRLDCDEIVSFTATVNDASRRVMRRLGMRHDPDGDFDHPSVPRVPCGDTCCSEWRARTGERPRTNSPAPLTFARCDAVGLARPGHSLRQFCPP